MIAAIALALFRLGFGMLSDIMCQRTADIIAFLELSLFVATNITFISAGVDEFPYLMNVSCVALFNSPFS